MVFETSNNERAQKKEIASGSIEKENDALGLRDQDDFHHVIKGLDSTIFRIAITSSNRFGR